MATYFKTELCIHCGAHMDLHQFETEKCPKNTWREDNLWRETSFEDSGIAKLNQAAPDLHDALVRAKEIIRIWHGINFKDEKQEQEAWEIYNKCAPEMNPINVVLEFVKPQV